jgi:hypothetical protein
MKLIQMRDHRVNKQTVQKRQKQYSRSGVEFEESRYQQWCRVEIQSSVTSKRNP